MNHYLQVIWTSSLHSFVAIIKWFLIALLARIAFVVGISVVFGIPLLTTFYLSGAGWASSSVVIVGILSFVACSTGFGILLKQIDPVLTLGTSQLDLENKNSES